MSFSYVIFGLSISLSLESGVGNRKYLLWNSETDLRSRRSDGDTVPTYTSLTIQRWMMVAVDSIRGFTRDIPRQRCH